MNSLKKIPSSIFIFFILIVLGLQAPVQGQAATPTDVHTYIQVTTANERSTLDRRTMKITSTADVTLTNTSSTSILAPLHGVIAILNATGAVTMPEALGGPSSAPYNKYYYNLSSKLSGGQLPPAGKVTFTVKFVRSSTVTFRYNVIPYGVLSAINQPPVANAGTNQNVTIPVGQTSMSVQLDGSASYDPDGNLSAWMWTGTPDPADVVKPALTLAAGTYTFTLVVTDNKGATSQASTVNVTVNPPPNQAPVANAGGNQNVTIPVGQTSMSVQLDGSASSDPDGSISAWTWTGTPDPADVVKPALNLAAGTYVFTLVVTDNKGATSQASTVNVTVNPPPNQAPVANAGGNQNVTIPVGQTSMSVQLDGSASYDPDGSISAWTWTGTPDPADVVMPTLPLAAGTYTFTLVVTDNKGATSQPSSVTIKVNQPPVANAGPNQTIKVTAGQTTATVTLDGSGSRDPDGTITQYVWSGTPDPADIISPTVNLSVGAYTFSLVVTDNNSAQSQPSNVTITVLPSNQPPVANAGSNKTIRLSPGQTSTVVFLDGSGSQDPDGTIIAYSWSGIPKPSDVISPPVTLSTGTNAFTLVVTDDNHAQSPSSTVTVTVLPPYQIPVANAGENRTLQLSRGQTSLAVTLDGSQSYAPDGTITKYFWSGRPNPDHVVSPVLTLMAGTYNFTLIVIDSNNTQSLPSNVTISVLPPINQSPTANAGADQILSLLPGQTLITTQLNGTGSFDPDGTIVAYNWSGPSYSATVARPTVSLPLGTHTFSLKVIDNQGAESTLSQVTIQVVQSHAPVLAVPSLLFSVIQGQQLTIDVSATDPDNEPVNLTATPVIKNSIFTANSGIAASGRFTFTPDSTQTGQHLVNFKARDLLGLSDTKVVQINVTQVNLPPVLTLPSSAAVDEGKILTVKAEVTDPNGDVVTLSASGLPPNALFIAATGTLTFTPDYYQAGVYPITITASDGQLLVSRTIQVTVNDVPTGGTGPGELVLQVDPMESPTFLATQRVTGSVNAPGGQPPAPKMKSALITGMSPTTGEQGQILAVTLTGQSSGDYATHFTNYVSQASFGSGISVTSVSVSSPTVAIVSVKIDPLAAEGPRSVSMVTGSETAVSVLAFSVTKGKSGVSGKVIDPNTKQPLTSGTISVQGTTLSAVINPDGTFTLLNVPSGNQTLIVNAPNHEFLAVPVVIQSGMTIDVGELQSAATVFDPGAPPSVSLFSVAGRNFGDVTGGLNIDDTKKVITDAILLVGGSEAGVLDEYGNQMNPGVSGNGMISITQEGVRLIAQKMQRGGETVSLGELLFAFSFGFQWSENKPMTLAEWLPLLQTLVNQAWWEPNKPENALSILIFNRGTNLSPDPPELSPYTRLNPAQAFLFASSLWSYIFRAPETQGGLLQTQLAADFNSVSDVPRPLIQLAQSNPPSQQQTSSKTPFTQFWRNAFEYRTDVLNSNINSAQASYLMSISSMAMPISLIALNNAQVLLGTAADKMMDALRDMRVASMIPDPPNSLTTKITTDEAGVPNVNVTFKLSPTQMQYNDSENIYVYSLFRYGESGSERKLVDIKGISLMETPINTLTLKDTEPLPLIKDDLGNWVRTPSATWFYTLTAARLYGGGLSTQDLINTVPWWSLPTKKLEVPGQSLIGTKQMLVSDYSAPVVVTVNASGEITVDEIAVDPQKGDVYLSDTLGGGTGNQPRFIKISENEPSKTFVYSGFKFPPGHRGLAIDKDGNLYTDNAASDEQFGGRLFKFFQPDGRREFVGNINYFSQQLMFARPTSGGPMAIGPGSMPGVSAEDLLVVDELEGMVKRVMVNATFDPFRRVGQPFANIPVAGKNLDLEVDPQGNVYLLKEHIASPVLALSMNVSKTYLSINDTFTVTLTVTNPGSGTINGVFPLPMVTVGDGVARILNLPTNPSVNLAAGESATFVFEYIAEGSGPINYSSQVQGTDANGYTVSSQFVKSNITVEITHQDPLEVWIEFPDKDTPIVSVNGKMTARLSLVASSNLTGDITNIVFHGNPLTFSLKDKLQISPDSPNPPIPADLMGVPLPMSLHPGEIQSFDFELTGVERGRVVLSSYVTGTDPDGKDLSASVQQTVKVDAPVLEVTVTPDPEALKLETDANDKPIPKNMAAKVTIKNIYTKPVETINLPGALTLFAVKEAYNVTGMNCSITQTSPDPNTTGPIMIGTLQPDESISRDFTFRADDDGKCDIVAYVASADPDDPLETLTTTGSGRSRVSKKILDLDIDFAKKVIYNNQGQSFEDTKVLDIDDQLIIYGTIRNLSTIKTVKITDILYGVFAPDAFHPSVSAAITSPVLGYEKSLWCDGCGVKPQTILDPGQTLRFEARVRPINEPSAIARLNLQYEVKGDAYEILGDKPNPETIESVTSGQVQKTLPVNYAKPPVDPKAVTDRFTYSLVESWGNAMTFPGKLVEMFWQEESRNRILASAGDHMRMLLKWWLEEMPDKKLELLQKYAIKGVQLPDQLMQQVNKEVEDVGRALGEGDYIFVADKLGKLAGEQIANVAWDILTCGAGVTVSVARKGLKEGLEQSMKGLFKKSFVSFDKIKERLPGRLRGLIAGEVLKIPGAAKMLGVAEQTIKDVNDIAERFQVIISARFRHPRATQLLAEVDEVTHEFKAIPKPEQVKLKTVSDIDVDFLGYKEEDIATIVFKDPKDIQLYGYSQDELKAILYKPNGELEEDLNLIQQKIQTQLKNPGGNYPGTGHALTDGDWQQAQLRFYKRVKEYQKHRKEILGIGRGPLDPPGWKETGTAQFKFRYQENGIPDPDVVKGYSFRMDEEGRMWVKGPNEFTEKRITGDVDLVDIRNPDGTHLTPEKRLEVYKELQEVAQIQHGDTGSWIADPTRRQEFFDAHKPGEEPLCQFAPDKETRVVHIDPNMSHYDSLDSYRAVFIGGYDHTKKAGL